MTHLTGEQLIDAVEGTLHRAGRRHLDACEACRREVGVLSLTLDAAGDGPVPEPSPLFWDHFSARVRAAVQADVPHVAAPSWHAWLRWQTLVPAGSMAALIVVLVSSLYESRPVRVAATAPSRPDAVTVEPQSTDADADREWRALAELVGPLDWDTADAAGLSVVPGDTDLAVLELDDQERQVLSTLIAGELARLKS